jgi:hypothetical protein
VKLILSAVDETLATVWHRFCGDLDFIEVHHGSILDVACDAIVSPANSLASWMVGSIQSIGITSDRISKCGFKSKSLSDITESCWLGLRSW